jgi:hypothetical protein
MYRHILVNPIVSNLMKIRWEVLHLLQLTGRHGKGNKCILVIFRCEHAIKVSIRTSNSLCADPSFRLLTVGPFKQNLILYTLGDYTNPVFHNFLVWNKDTMKALTCYVSSTLAPLDSSPDIMYNRTRKTCVFLAREYLWNIKQQGDSVVTCRAD